MTNHSKRILSFVAIVLSLVACNKEEKNIDPIPERVFTDMMLVVPAFQQQLQMIDHTFTLNIGGSEEVKVSGSQLKDITDDSKYSEAVSAISSRLSIMPIVPTGYRIYAYDLGTFYAGDILAIKEQAYSAKAGRPSVERFNIFEAVGFYSSFCKQVTMPSATYYEGVPGGSELEEFCELLTKTVSLTFTVPSK